MLIKSELEQMLHSLEMERKKCNDELAGLPAGTLISSVRNKQPVCFIALGTKETYRRISIKSDEETKRGLARKKYLQLRLMRIEEDIAALRNANQWISGMTNDEIYRLRENIKKLNVDFEQKYLYDNCFEKWADPNDLYWEDIDADNFIQGEDIGVIAEFSSVHDVMPPYTASL